MGTLSWTLLLLAANGGLMAVLLAAAPGNARANRFLAALCALISLRLAIYILGFAGVYDDHPWITFAPLDLSLAFGPLLWLYLVSLTRGAPPAGWRWHLLPATAQLGYYLVAFALPLDAKRAWFGGPHLRVMEPVGLALLLLSCCTYLALSWRRQRHYQRWLDSRFADRERWRLGWISGIVGAFGLLLATAVAATTIHLFVAPLDYFGRTPVVVASSLIAYALGLLGWRHAALDLPAQPRVDPPAPPAAPSRPAAAVAGWVRRIEAEGWWREEGLTLGEVAARLAVSERTLSRGLTEGLGTSFNALVNGQRVAAVQRAIAGGSDADLLSIAFDCGFASKASFNRAFMRHAGMTPSAWRAATAQHPPIGVAGVG